MIKKLRTTLGISQERLAEQTGLSLRTIQRAEAGHRVSYSSLRALADTFDLNVDELEWELYAMNKSSEEFTEAPRWARLLLRKGWYTTNRKWSVITEKVCASVFLVCLLIYLSPFFEGESMHTVSDLSIEYQILITGLAFLMSAYWMSFIIRMSDYYSAWTQWDSSKEEKQ